MTKFYTLLYAPQRDGLIRVVRNGFMEYDYMRLWDGEPLEPLPADLRLAVTGDPADYVLNHMSWPILSQRTVDLLGPELKKDAQLFRAPLFDEAGKEVNGYWILNPIRRLRCLDADKSAWAGTPAVGYSLARPVIQSRLVPDEVQLFRIDESPDSGILFRFNLVSKLEGQGLTGIAFQIIDAT